MLPELSGSPDLEDEALEALIHGNTDFALNLHRQLEAETEGNRFTAPYSITTALSMTYAGAEGETAEQFTEVMGLLPDEETHDSMQFLGSELRDRAEMIEEFEEDDEEIPAFEIQVANAFWGAEQITWDDRFSSILEISYGAALKEADFLNQPETERQRINDWVAERTEEHIDGLLPEGSIIEETAAVLTNAIYFLARWQHEFDPADTTADTFNNADGSQSSVPFMQQSIRTRYGEFNGTEVIELPYQGGVVSMVLLVPPEGRIKELEDSLDAEMLYGMFNALEIRTGELRMPRFEIDFSDSLKDALMELGLELPFSTGANFEGMVEEGPRLMIDDVFHETWLSVDEEGTEAAGATAVVMVPVSAPPSFGELIVDRPFLCCIRDQPTNAILFLGRVVDL